ncbi:hypothetical protein TNCV_3616311 [Trichonephila clavipes]|nr:hypothetical protein TNCV_3616311 [Trichonephila clavipes]
MILQYSCECVNSLERQSLKNAWNKLWSDLECEKDFNDDHREEITDFVQSIPGFQECDEEDVQTWMACEAEDSGFQMLNDDEIVTSVDSYEVVRTTECCPTQLLLLKRVGDLAAKKRRCPMVQRKISDYFRDAREKYIAILRDVKIALILLFLQARFPNGDDF